MKFSIAAALKQWPLQNIKLVAATSIHFHNAQMKNILTKNHWFTTDILPSTLNELLPLWLTNTYVLTQAIKNKCRTYSLKLIAQGLTNTTADDSQVLRCQNQQSFVRRVLQSGDGIPVCYARTTIPFTTFEKYRTEFENLNEKPIGETLLYNNSEVTRSKFEFCCLTSENSLMQEVMQASNASYDELWARRSLFWIKQDPLLITEVFAPEMHHILTTNN